MRRLILGLASLALVAAACGGASDDGSDEAVATAGPGGLQATVVGPPAHGVDADAQQLCGLSHPKVLHLPAF